MTATAGTIRRSRWLGVPASLARAAAVGIAVVSVALELTNIWITAQLPRPAYTPLPFAPEDMAGTAFPLFGALLVLRLPRLVIGWLLCLGGLGAATNIVVSNLARLIVLEGGHPAVFLLWLLASAAWGLTTYALGILLPMLYPTGRILSKRWCVPGGFAAVALAADWVRVLIKPSTETTGHNPLAVAWFAPYHHATRSVLAAAITLSLVLAFSSLVVRFRQADPAERRQILWPLLAISALVVPWAIGDPIWWTASLTIPLIPAAITVAVLRYRLFGIDTVVSRTLVAAGLVGVIAGAYVLAGAASSFFLAGVDQLFGLAAALVAGAFFQPTRNWLQRLADRALYGRHGDPIALADGLKHRLQQADPGHGLLAALETLRDGLAVTGTAVEIDGATTAAGELAAISRTVPLVWHGRPVGTLLIGPPGRRSFPAAHDERVIAVLAPYVADAVHTMRLTTALRSSRERILTAREEERRRLRRDLHDGLGQTLTLMAMTINMARVSLQSSPDLADNLLKELRTGMDAVSGDIRELVYGLRPPALDDLGLAGAVRALEPDGPVVEVDGDLDGLPAAVEVAAYRIVQEALHNIRKHAQATWAKVLLRRTPDALLIEVCDDGVGLPPGVKSGVGLGSMRERASELGGTCAIASDTAGTTVTARLPL
ncbi:sensor histidine kinase [Acrocarpospora catenulata]|uniref:sensor histidine kinase n=1 Tax=Acrocarpospora catenulata TaxID=2836182 RepID=UPI001BD98CEC|nr:sensor histidine kinase [Acrocarpospora catenulata]